MKKKAVIILVILFAFLCILIAGGTFYIHTNLEPVDKNSHEKIEIIIPSGTITSKVISILKEKDLIKNELVTKLYAKINANTLMAGRYILTKSMSTIDILNDLKKGNVTNDTIWITFIEGKRLSYIENQIANNFPYTIEEIHTVLEDRDYIKELIQRYDILTDSILDSKIMHPLEGYLFADTYEFAQNVTIKGIIEKMIGTLNTKMQKYKSDIEKSKLSIHELLTLASVVELEEATKDDRKGVAGVFYNRLNSGWTLGSDATTYYAVNKDFDKELKLSELNSCNAYNTRGTCVKGLPAGPIGSPSISSIEAVIYPTKHDYYYFVDDVYGKTYYSKTESEHNATIRKLQKEGKWYTY